MAWDNWARLMCWFFLQPMVLMMKVSSSLAASSSLKMEIGSSRDFANEKTFTNLQERSTKQATLIALYRFS